MTAIRKRHDRFAEADFDQEIVIMRLDNGDFYSLSEASAAVWRLIDGERDKAALVAAACLEYDMPEQQVALEVDGFLRLLHETGFLTEA